MSRQEFCLFVCLFVDLFDIFVTLFQQSEAGTSATTGDPNLAKLGRRCRNAAFEGGKRSLPGWI